MNSAFLLSLFAGLSTVLGCVFLFIKFKKENLLIGKTLSFASGVMVAVSIFDLLPTAFTDLYNVFYIFPAIIISGIFIIVGIIITMLSNKFFLSNNNNMQNSQLYKTGIFSMVAIMLHNIPEGIATFLTASSDIKLGISLAIAIALHNIPEGISISIPISYSTNNRARATFYTLIAGISEFFGAVIAHMFFRNVNVEMFLTFLYLIIAGIMISLAFEELIPTAKKYLSVFSLFIWFLFGFIFMITVKLVL